MSSAVPYTYYSDTTLLLYLELLYTRYTLVITFSNIFQDYVSKETCAPSPNIFVAPSPQYVTYQWIPAWIRHVSNHHLNSDGDAKMSEGLEGGYWDSPWWSLSIVGAGHIETMMCRSGVIKTGELNIELTGSTCGEVSSEGVQGGYINPP